MHVADAVIQIDLQRSSFSAVREPNFDKPLLKFN